MGPFQHVRFIYFYLSTGAQNRTCTARWVSWLLHMEVDPSLLFDRSSIGLGSPWVSLRFVEEMVWKRSRLLNCTLSQHKQRAFPPGPRNGPRHTPPPHTVAARFPPASMLRCRVRGQDKPWAFRSEDVLGRGLRGSCPLFGFGSVWVPACVLVQ